MKYLIGFILGILCLFSTKVLWGYSQTYPQCGFFQTYTILKSSIFSPLPEIKMGCHVTNPDMNGFKDYDMFTTIPL